jgi:hypothetical protein
MKEEEALQGTVTFIITALRTSSLMLFVYRCWQTNREVLIDMQKHTLKWTPFHTTI